nr:retrovirus-related Pol polyprotein from transposon TNT 1-94 [Tanacetum cinerariifolium]
MIDSQMDDMIKEKLTLKEQVDSLEQNLSKKIMEKECLLQTFTAFKRESKEKEDKNIENEIDLEKKLKELDNIIFKVGQSAQTVHILTKPQVFYDNIHKQALAQLQDKDTTICKLKDIIKSMREKSKDENVNYDYVKIEIKYVELENSVAKLISNNKRLCNEINHVKQVFKEQFDSIKKTCVRTKEQGDSLIDKLNLKSAENEDLKAQILDKVFVITYLKNDLRKIKGKEIVDIATQKPSVNTIVPGMFKLDLVPLAPKLLENKEAHIDYLKYTQEQTDILQGIELLVYVRDTCPHAINLSAKKVAVTPKNKVKKVRFVEPLTSSSNIKQVESSTTSDSNTAVLSPTELKCSTSNYGSKPTGNKKNERISQTPSRNMKKKVEAKPRKVNKKNRVVEQIHNVDVKQSQLNANSELSCATCKKYMFDGVHDMCLLDFVKNVVLVVLWYLDSGCLKDMTGNCSQLMNFVSKFSITVRFENDHIARIMRSKDEAPEAIIKCIKNIQVRLNATVRNVQTDNRTKFVNQTLREFYENVGISHQTSVARTPQQNDVVERRNQTLVEAAHTIDDWDHLFQPMFDEYFNPPTIAVSPVPVAAAPRAIDLADSPVSTSIDQDAPSTSKKRELIFQMDVKMEFLNGELKKEVYNFHPEGFVNQDNPSHVYKLKKALYGLKRAPRAWYDMLSIFLISQHFSKGAVDPTLFTPKAGNDLLLVENEVVELYFVRTEYQLADIFTKPLPRERFNFLIEKLGTRSMSSERLKCLAEEEDE